MFKILAIDGGGIRGMIPAYTLVQLEKLIGAPLKEYFDMVIGTSSGAILAALVCHPQHIAASDIYHFYMTRCRKIFKISLWERILSFNGWLRNRYDSKSLEMLLQDLFGDFNMNDLSPECLIPAYNVSTGEIHVFSNNGINTNEVVWKAIRAATAAPSYFEGVTTASGGSLLIDGGVFANNPSLLAMQRVCGSGGTELSRVKILSVGTGACSNFHLKGAGSWGALRWAKHFVDLQMGAATEAVDAYLRSVLTREQYFRINVVLPYLKLDDVSVHYEKLMLGKIEEYFEEYESTIKAWLVN